ncbi:MAG: FeoB-associated Cys-rich membrane protein [Ruminiclostridium sp.]|nr:FeoB-associated Cys-rich membrane protein [Ruminiclostridium sp.]
MNLVDIILIVLIAAAVAGALFVMIRDKKKGKGCCGNCSCCGGSGECRKADKPES